MTKKYQKPIKMVINADDFGYFTCVSRGIIECAQSGAITATGVMANGPNFYALADWLQEVPQIDIGAHLNLTYGHPVSMDCQRLLASNNGFFKSKMATAGMLMRKEMSVSDVKSEWRAQIDKCLAAGLVLTFINSHEHIHVLPVIERLLPELAQEYGIGLIRTPRPDWGCRPINKLSLMRNALLGLAFIIQTRRHSGEMVRVLGIGASGKLTLRYLERCFSKLPLDAPYELMCHPGIYDPNEISDRQLTSFHAWDQERRVLLSEGMKTLLLRNNINLCRFSELDMRQSQ